MSNALDHNLIARTCHEANRALQVFTGEEVSPPWDQAPIRQKMSALEGVRKALLGVTSEELHDSWGKNLLDQGWSWGPVKNEKFKQHPCLIPYEELGEEQRVKDRVFNAIVTAFKTAHQQKSYPAPTHVEN